MLPPAPDANRGEAFPGFALGEGGQPVPVECNFMRTLASQPGTGQSLIVGIRHSSQQKIISGTR